jgi:hypothetical protein
MCRDGCPVHHFDMHIFDAAREAAPAIQQHRWDKALTGGLGLRHSKRKGLGDNHVHYR